jgi:hypothetical protein
MEGSGSFLATGDFSLSELPFKTISDCEDNGGPFSVIITRRSGLQFGGLTPHQKRQLEYFIQNNTVGEV